MNTDLHAYVWRTFPDAQTRRANGQYSASDVGRIAYQIDDATFWRIDNVINPGANAIPTWTQINGDELPGLTIRGAGNPIDNVTTITFPDATIVNLGNGEVQVLTGGGGGGGGAPINAEYITASPNATLTNERVLTNTPTVVWDTTVPGQVRADVPDGGIITPKLADKSVEYGKIQDVTPNRLLGRSATPGSVQEIQIGTGLSLSGTTLSATGGGGAPTDAQYVVTATDPTLTNERVLTNTPTVVWDTTVPGQVRADVPDGGISYNKVQNVSANRILGRGATPGPVQEIQIGEGLSLSGTTLSATGGGGGGAPTDAQYVVTATDPTLTNERVLTNTPTVVWDTTVPGQVRAEVPDGSISYNKVQNVSASRLLGRSATPGPVQEIQIGTGLSLTGTTLSATGGGGGGAPEDAEYIVGAANSGLTNERVVTNTSTVVWDLSVPGQVQAEVPDNGITTSKIAPGAVTYNRIQNVTNGRLLGRSGFMSGPVQEIQIGTGLVLSGGVLQSTVTSGSGGCVFGVDDSLLGQFMVRNNPGWNNQVNGSNITTVSFIGPKPVLTMEQVLGGSSHYSAYYWDSPASSNFIIQGVLNAIGRIDGSASRFFGMYVGDSSNALVVGIEESSSQLQRLRVSSYIVSGDVWDQIGGSDYSIVWTPNFAIRIEVMETKLKAYILNYPGYLCRFYSTTSSFFTSIDRVGLFVQRDSNWTTHFFCHDFRVV